MIQKKITQKSYTWNDIEIMIKSIINKIKQESLQFDFIVGIPRGGLIMGVMLSHQLNIPYMEFTDFINKPFGYGRILLVDEVAGRGTTLKRNLRFFDNLKTTMFTFNYKQQSVIKPYYYCEEVPNDVWIVYPWEN